MTTPVAPKRPKLPPIEYADRTLELDLRGLDSEEPEAKTTAPADTRRAFANGDDPTLVLDLTATQVHKLIGNE